MNTLVKGFFWWVYNARYHDDSCMKGKDLS